MYVYFLTECMRRDFSFNKIIYDIGETNDQYSDTILVICLNLMLAQ